MNNGIPEEESYQRGLWTKIKDKFLGGESEDEYEDDDYQPENRRTPVTLKLQSTRVMHVAVRQPLSIEDARLAADGLKDGRQQIINMEKTEQDKAERIIDFLNGVTYALNGFVEKIGDRVYLFAPSNVVIDVPMESYKPSRLFDNNQ